MIELPRLDQPASAFFTFEDLCHCGETWQAMRVDNVPLQAETYEAISRLCETILDAVVREFGQLRLTYGFAGQELARKVPGRISPKLDQHAGHELRASGEPICPRLGQAADFHVDGVSSVIVGRFIAGTLAFDRLYLYGPDRPLHVSVGPEQARAIFEMRWRGSRRVPRALRPSEFTQALLT